METVKRDWDMHPRSVDEIVSDYPHFLTSFPSTISLDGDLYAVLSRPYI